MVRDTDLGWPKIVGFGVDPVDGGMEVGNRLHIEAEDGVAGSLCLHEGTTPDADPTGARLWVDTSHDLYLLEENATPTTRVQNKIVREDANGFVKLGDGAPSIKMKKLTGTSPAVGASSTIAHGLDKSKIIGAQVLVANDTGNRIPPNFTSVANHEFDFFIDSTYVHIYCISGNSSNINGNAVTVLIIYEE